MIMLIAVFSVFIIGTYTILNRHVSNTVDSEADNGAYYTGEGVLRITSTEIDKLAYKISNDANINEEVLTRDEFVTRLNATIASQVDNYFVSKIEPGSFAEYNIDSVTVVPSSLTSDEYTCLYDITAIISNDRNTRKKITGIYGVLYLTESSQSTHTNYMIINESTPMLTAMENITSENSVSLNGNAKLTGNFSYPGHYNATTDAEHYQNNGHEFKVDTSSLVRGNVKISTLPSPPYEGDQASIKVGYALGPNYANNIQSADHPVINIPFMAPLYYPNTPVERVDCELGGTTNIDGHSLTINVDSGVVNGYLRSGVMNINDDLIINIHCDGFIFDLGQVTAGENGKIIINTNGHDVIFKYNNLYIDKNTKDIDIITTGTGRVYMYFYQELRKNNSWENNSFSEININVTNEETVTLCIVNNLYVDHYNNYEKVIFNAKVPDDKSKAGDVNFFVIDNKSIDNNHKFGINRGNTMAFNSPEGTRINVIADNLEMYGNLEITGGSNINIYARKRCTFDGEHNFNLQDGHYVELKTLSNFSFTDKDLEENEKASKIIETGLNIYYYGSEDLIIRHYMCCSNFYSAGSANINIDNCLFYGNLFSSAPEPQNGQKRAVMNFRNSYLSCGAIYAPRMNINIDGKNTNSRFNERPNIYITDEGNFATCIFACVTGHTINFTGNSMAKSSNVATEHMELEVEMEFMPGVVAIGDSYSGSNFFRGFKIE